LSPNNSGLFDLSLEKYSVSVDYILYILNTDVTLIKVLKKYYIYGTIYLQSFYGIRRKI